MKRCPLCDAPVRRTRYQRDRDLYECTRCRWRRNGAIRGGDLRKVVSG